MTKSWPAGVRGLVTRALDPRSIRARSTRLILPDHPSQHSRNEQVSKRWTVLYRGVGLGGTALALTEATSCEGQTIREGGTESRGSLGDGRVASWAAQTVRLSVRRRHVERGPFSPQPGNSSRVLEPPRPRRHQPTPCSPFHYAVTLFRLRRERQEGGGCLGSAGRFSQWFAVRQSPPGGDPERCRSSLRRPTGQ